MKGLLSYSGLTTKIRAMQSHLLNDRNYREIVELPNVPAAVTYLKQQPSYQELFQGLEETELHRGQIEQLLHLAVYRDFSKLYRFSNLEQRKFLSSYFKRYEIAILKECLNKIFDHRDVVLNLSVYQSFFDKHSQLDFASVTSSSSPEELISSLKGTEYYDPLVHLGTLEHPTLFDYEMTLDLYYFGHLWKQREKIAQKKDLEELTKAWGSKFDMLNLQWVYRSKQYYHMTSADIYALIIPVHYRLKKSELQTLVEAESMDVFRQLIRKTYYAKHFEQFSTETMESMYAEIMKHILSSASRSNPYSLATVYSYLYHKDLEINRLIIALECVRYGISPDEAMQYVAKT